MVSIIAYLAVFEWIKPYRYQGDNTLWTASLLHLFVSLYLGQLFSFGVLWSRHGGRMWSRTCHLTVTPLIVFGGKLSAHADRDNGVSEQFVAWLLPV